MLSRRTGPMRQLDELEGGFDPSLLAAQLGQSRGSLPTWRVKPRQFQEYDEKWPTQCFGGLAITHRELRIKLKGQQDESSRTVARRDLGHLLIMSDAMEASQADAEAYALQCQRLAMPVEPTIAVWLRLGGASLQVRASKGLQRLWKHRFSRFSGRRSH